MRRPVRLQCPDFHLAESLAAELRLSGERLLRHQRVRADGPRVDLVVHQVRQLHHVDGADGHLRREPFAGPTIPQAHLAGGREASRTQELARGTLDVGLTLRSKQRGQLRIGCGHCFLLIERSGLLGLFETSLQQGLLGLAEIFRLEPSLVVGDLHLGFQTLPLGQLLGGRLEEISCCVEQIPRFLRHRAARQCIDLERSEHGVALFRRKALEVVQQDPDGLR